MLLRSVFLLGLWLAFAGTALSQSKAPIRLLEAFTFRQGLSDNRVRAVTQDEKGFIWIGTANGLNRYDGYTFWHYFPVKGDSTSIPSTTVNALVKDKKGALWMATGNGICRLRPGPWVFERVLKYPEQIDNPLHSYFENVYPDPEGRVWAVSNPGDIYCVDAETHAFQKIQLPSVPNAPAVVPANVRQKPARPTWVTACGDTAVLFGTTYGLFQLNTRNWSFRFFPVPEAWPFGLSRMTADSAGGIWASTYLQGLVRVNLRSGAVTHYPTPESSVTDILTMPDGRLWLAGVSGLTHFDPATLHSEKIQLPFEADLSLNAFGLFRDQSGIIWISTENGLAKYDPKLQGFHYTEVHREGNAVFENDIYDVHENPDDGLRYISSRQQNAIFVQDKNGKLIERVSTLPQVDPTRVFRDSKGRLWVTTRFQVFQFDRQRRKLIPMPTPARREGRAGLIWAIAEDPQGRLWFGTSRDGIFIYDPRTGQMSVPGPESGFKALRINKILMDRGGKYAWITTDNEGFYECELATMQFKKFDDAIQEGLMATSGLVQDRDGRVWICGPEGLFRYTPGAPAGQVFRQFTMADGLPMNYVDGGILDRQGDLWFGAGERLMRLDPETNRIKTFDYRYGASRTPFGYYDFSISPSGELFAGGRRGFLRWQPDKLLDNREPPIVVVTNLKAAREDVPAPTSEVDRIWLQYNENSFRVEFAALNFTLPDDNLYQWKLEGYDHDWSAPSRQREAIYAHIPPGKYTLLVKAANNDGVWNYKPLPIQIQIFPAFWQTWWFRVLAASLVAGMVYSFIRWRVRQIQERERLHSTFNQRLAEVEMSALRAQMNPHFIFNCLNSINRFILLNQPLVASQYLTKFARLIRLVLDNSKSEMISLEKELETLRLYIEMEAVRFEGRFQYQIQVDELIDIGSIDIPPMLIQPYVENAIWHGLLHKKGNEGQLDIGVHLHGRDLLIAIADNGVGRAAAQALKSKSASEHKSHGMNVTAERLKLLSNLYNQDIHARVEDLLYRDGAPAGTKVVLTIPVLR
ncbi:MAG: histidine kinase [Saprospiraceae bacterium]|nr:histidine kinase [Saprospiraceae bacterium]